jgi:transcription elongation factor SPT5
MYSGGRTPMHGSQTPLYDGKEYARDMTLQFVRTTVFDRCVFAGSRTPHYGGATPLHDGSRTPGAEAWNPSYTNTPARHSEIDGYTLDDSYHMSSEYVPQTPGSNYASSDNSYSPYNTASPSGGYHSEC